MIEPPRPSLRSPIIEWATRVWYFIRAIRPKAGPGIELRETPSGTIISVRPGPKSGAAKSLPCALGTMKSAAEGNVYLSAGYIDAAGDHHPVGGEGTAFTPTVGHHVWAEIVLTADVEEDVLTGSYSASGAAIVKGAAVPSDHEWTPEAPSGKAYAPLGNWASNGEDPPVPVWQGHACGNVHFRLCTPNTVAASASYYRG